MVFTGSLLAIGGIALAWAATTVFGLLITFLIIAAVSSQQ